MAKVISFSEIEDYTNNTKNTKLENKLLFPKKYADGYLKQEFLAKGLGIHYIDLKIKEDFFINNKFEKKLFSFCSFLKGNMFYENKSFDVKKEFKTNQFNMSALNFEDAQSFYKKGSHVKAVNIFATSDFVKENILNEKSDSKLNEVLENLNHKPYFNFFGNSNYAYEINKNFQNILNSNFNDKLQNLLIKSQVYEILFNSFKSLEEKTNPLSLNQQDISYLNKVEKYILENLSADLSLKTLAKVAASNETKLQKNFKIHNKTTLFKYITEVKMNKAKELLQDKSYSIAEIADSLGYKHQSNFTNAFINKFGISPKNFYT